MIVKETNGIKVFNFERFLNFSNIRHGIFTRCGGSSQGPYQSLNVGKGLGDKSGSVNKNRVRISGSMGGENIVYINQNHGTEILVFNRSGPGGGQIKGSDLLVGDAMVTDIPEMFIAIQVADCQAVLMFDPVKKVVANVHAGWRGSIKNIIGRTVGVMKETFGCNPGDITAGIGPSLGPCCAEFRNYRKEIPEPFWKYKNRQNHFDFWSMSTDQLVSAGVLLQHISRSGLCTKCRADLFYSYRGEGITGRFAAVIGLV
jgi:polyphenol oxidase